MKWQLQDAKRRFSELVRRAEREGPQVVTRQHSDVVVVLSIDEYRRLQAQHFKDFLTAARNLDSLPILRDASTAPVFELAEDSADP